MKPQDFASSQTGNKIIGSLQLYVPRPKNINEIFKPTSGFMYSVIWTSTAQKLPNGSYTSEWVEWCKHEMPDWLSSEGSLYKVKPGARILSMNTDKDAFNIGKYYGVKPPKDMVNTIMWAQKFPWDEIENDFDAVHHVPSGSRVHNILMSSWDVESTAWFNTNYLQNMGQVKVNYESQ